MQQPSAHKAAAADDDRNRKPSRKKLRTRFNDARLLELTGSLFFFLFFFQRAQFTLNGSHFFQSFKKQFVFSNPQEFFSLSVSYGRRLIPCWAWQKSSLPS